MANTLWSEYLSELETYIKNTNVSTIGKQSISSPDGLSIVLADREALWIEYNRVKKLVAREENGITYKPIRLGVR